LLRHKIIFIKKLKKERFKKFKNLKNLKSSNLLIIKKKLKKKIQLGLYVYVDG
jgi:hypothetical protein